MNRPRTPQRKPRTPLAPQRKPEVITLPTVDEPALERALQELQSSPEVAAKGSPGDIPREPSLVVSDKAEDSRLLAEYAAVQARGAAAPKASVTPPANSLDAEKARDKMMVDTLRQRSEDRARVAQMAAEAVRNGEPIPAVSSTTVEYSQDPSLMLGEDGKSLIGPGEVGQIVSMEDPDNRGKTTDQYWKDAVAKGARMVLRDDGQPVRQLGGIGVAWPIAVSARRMAAANANQIADEDLDPRLQRAAQMARQGGMLAPNLGDAGAQFMEDDMEAAQSGVIGNLRQRAEGIVSRSHDITV